MMNLDALDLILGESFAIKQLKSLIQQVASTDITVLIAGESGTGKELVANALHNLSPRWKHNIVTVNCGAIPEGIFESEIFGHEKGSFTSADRRRNGYFETADKGTLFLDEIGEMPLQVQVKLLRVLETGRFLRVGGSEEVQVDVRVIAATNKNLGMEVTQRRFRQDLYYRLKAVNITIPPLRERAEDIPLLIEHFTGEFAGKNQRQKPIFDSGSIDVMQRHYWEGNVRELKNFVESIIALSPRDHISIEDVLFHLSEARSGSNLPILAPRPPNDFDQQLIYRTLLELRQDVNQIKDLLQRLLLQRSEEIIYPFTNVEEVEAYSLDVVERDQIRRTLADFNGNRRKAAQVLGIGERTLYRKIKQYGI